jgi:hypothetical protein
MSYWTDEAEIDAFYNLSPELFFDLFSEFRQGRKPSLDNVHPQWREIVAEALTELDPGSATGQARDIAARAWQIYKRRQQANDLAKLRQDGSCPKCGDLGRFIRGALVCTKGHGAYAGI